MEGVAAAAGVSKALPYAHFDNAQDLLVALYRREIRRLGMQVTEAIGGVDDPARRVAAAVHAYFDFVSTSGGLVAALAAARAVERSPDGTRAGHRFVADLFREMFSLPQKQAMACAVVTLAVLGGAAEAWTRGDARRTTVEAMAVRAILALVTQPL